MPTDFEVNDELIFSEINGLSEVDPILIDKWKQEGIKENWNGLLVFKGEEGLYYVPYDTNEEMKKIFSYYESIDFFVGKIDLPKS